MLLPKSLAIPVLAISVTFPGLAKADLTERQAQLLAVNCLQYHACENIGVPVMGNPDDWRKRNRQGEDVLLRNVAQGLFLRPAQSEAVLLQFGDLAGVRGNKIERRGPVLQAGP